MSYRIGVSRNRRIYFDQPAKLVAEATSLAKTAGHPLTTYLYAVVIASVKAAEAGHAERLPIQPQRPAGFPQPREGEQPEMTKVGILASHADQARWSRALEAHGSSLLAVIGAALTAFVESGGSWADTPTPGEPGHVWRVAGAA